MTPETPRQRTQAPSTRARKSRLFESDEVAGAVGPPRESFAECLRRTPAAPLSGPVKAGLWTVGTLVILLLAAALATGGRRKPEPPRPRGAVSSQASDFRPRRA